MATPNAHFEIHMYTARPLRLDDMDDQVSRPDLVGQQLSQTGVRFDEWPGLSGASHSPWKLPYEGAMIATWLQISPAHDRIQR